MMKHDNEAEGVLDNIHHNLAILLHQQRQWSGAIYHYQQTIALAPANAIAHFNLGMAFDQQELLNAAVVQYQKAIALQPDYIEAYSNLGSVFLRVNQVEAAIATYQRAIAIDPSWAMLYNNLGQAFAAQQNWERAIDLYRQAIHLNPQMALAYRNLGRLFHQRNQYELASFYFQKLLELDPQNIAAYGDLGSALLQQGEIDRAMNCFHQAILIDPKFVEAYFRFLDRHVFDEWDATRQACAQFLQGLQQSPDDPMQRDRLAKVYQLLGHLTSTSGNHTWAEIYTRNALQLQPDRLDLYLQLYQCLSRQNCQAVDWGVGVFLEQQGRFAEAIELYRQFLSCPQPIAPKIRTSPILCRGIYLKTAHWSRATLDLCDRTSNERAKAFVSQFSEDSYREVSWGSGLKHSNEEQSQTESEFLCPLPVAPQAAPFKMPCAGVGCHPCMDQLQRQFQPTLLQNGLYACTQQPIAVEPRCFVAQISGGRVWVAPQQNSWRVCNGIAVFTADHCLLADVSRHYPWYLPGCSQHNSKQHPVFDLEELPPLEIKDGTVAVLSGLSGHVYYHWMVDIFPRLGILRRGGFGWDGTAWDEIDWFLINSQQKAFQKETLAALGIPSHKILESDRHPHVQAKRLVVPSFPGHMDWVSEGTIQFLRDIFLPQKPDDGRNKSSKYPERIYISRATADYRRVLNEAEVIEALESVGVVSVTLESLPVREQAELFFHCKTIVAPHGSGLTNLVFCQPGTRVVELFSPNYVRTDYWIVSQRLGLQHYYIKGESFECEFVQRLMNPNPLTEDLYVSSEAIEGILRMLQS
jgi:tetratricopeptide (TPR) repeat protein/capsular polysaccharide biosynthesis protein